MGRASEQANALTGDRASERTSARACVSMNKRERGASVEEGWTRTGSRLARKHLPEEDVASSTEPGRIDYPVSHLNTCSLPFTVLSRVCVRTHFARASCTQVVRDRLCEHIWVPDRMGTPAKILLIPFSVLWSGMKDRSSSVSVSRRLSTRVFVDTCIYVFIYG